MSTEYAVGSIRNLSLCHLMSSFDFLEYCFLVTYFSPCNFFEFAVLVVPWERSNSEQESNTLHNFFVSFIFLTEVYLGFLCFLFFLLLFCSIFWHVLVQINFLELCIREKGDKELFCFLIWKRQQILVVSSNNLFLFMSWIFSAELVLPIIHMITYKQGW